MAKDYVYLRDAFDNIWVKALRSLKSDLWWLLFVFLLFVPMLIDFVYLNDYLPILQAAIPFWSERPAVYVLSDILFLEAGFFLIFGAMFAGVVLYLAWSPGWMALFVDPVFRWEIIKKEREIPAAFIVGLVILAAGVIYILAAILITL
jgi:hypothetical protein